jgi:hypothetical protein
MPTDKPHVKIYLPQEQMDQLTAEAAKREISLSELIRQVLIKAKVMTPTDMKWGGNRHEK